MFVVLGGVLLFFFFVLDVVCLFVWCDFVLCCFLFFLVDGLLFLVIKKLSF